MTKIVSFELQRPPQTGMSTLSVIRYEITEPGTYTLIAHLTGYEVEPTPVSLKITLTFDKAGVYSTEWQWSEWRGNGVYYMDLSIWRDRELLDAKVFEYTIGVAPKKPISMGWLLPTAAGAGIGALVAVMLTSRRTT